MKRRSLAVLGLLSIALCTGCAGLRETNGAFVAHAESFRIFGYAIPGDDQKAAMDQVPPGATITSVSSTPADWSSVTGVLLNIFGFHTTQIGGTK